MVNTVIIHVEGFREWTHDKEEYVILSTQHELYAFLTTHLGEIGVYLYPNLYDNLIGITNSMNLKEYQSVITKAERKFKFKLTSIHGNGESIAECLNVKAVEGYVNGYHDIDISTKSVFAYHFDIDTYLGNLSNIYSLNIYVSEILDAIREYFPELVGFHVSGDNYIFFGESYDPESFYQRFHELNKRYSLKVGIGVSRFPSKAASLSAEALGAIRAKRRVTRGNLTDEDRIHVINDQDPDGK